MYGVVTPVKPNISIPTLTDTKKICLGVRNLSLTLISDWNFVSLQYFLSTSLPTRSTWNCISSLRTQLSPCWVHMEIPQRSGERQIFQLAQTAAQPSGLQNLPLYLFFLSCSGWLLNSNRNYSKFVVIWFSCVSSIVGREFFFFLI